MKKISSETLLSFFILLLAFVSVNQWNKIPLGNTFFVWIISFIIIILIFWTKKQYFHPSNKNDYFIVLLYLGWMLTGVIRGILVTENYFEWKQLIQSSLSLSIPLFVYVFSIPEILHNTLKVWIKYALPAFFIFFIWVISRGALHFYLGPIFLLSCFLPVLKRKWQLIFLGLLVIMMFANFGARSQVIKSIATILIIFASLMREYISTKALKIAHWVLYILPIFLLYLGISGEYNIFSDGLEQDQGKYLEERVINGEKDQEDLAADTRTFIYIEVIQSAIENNYVFWGRTPARGNDTSFFDDLTADELVTGKYERSSNEVCFPNVFTWLGLIGMTLYCLIYLKSSYLAIYKSNNSFIKLIGILTAFHFFYGWIEDFNRFDIMNVSIWMMISMGFSEQFRKMTDLEFKYWVRNIF